MFPAFRTSRRPLSENTVNQVFRRLGFAVGEVTAHGLRTTASTLLNESGKWSPDAIERSLAHADKDAVRGTYNRGAYWEERVARHQWWSDYLDDLRASASGGTGLSRPDGRLLRLALRVPSAWRNLSDIFPIGKRPAHLSGWGAKLLRPRVDGLGLHCQHTKRWTAAC